MHTIVSREKFFSVYCVNQILKDHSAAQAVLKFHGSVSSKRLQTTILVRFLNSALVVIGQYLFLNSLCFSFLWCFVHFKFLGGWKLGPFLIFLAFSFAIYLFFNFLFVTSIACFFSSFYCFTSILVT